MDFARVVRSKLIDGEPIVGVAIGVGMAAIPAARGGADFILALNAGRYRVMGAPSLASMLPLADANNFTDEFAQREFLGRVSVPVFFGASSFDPRLDLKRLVNNLASAGYAGIANFPSSIHYSGRFRQALEESGMGFDREVEMLRHARNAGLAAFGYAKTMTEVAKLEAADIDILCLNFGWNAGGMRNVAQEFTLDEASDRARRIFRRLRQSHPDLICLVEGGPIVTPDDMYRVWQDAKADGYVGGSTFDRVPVESAIYQMTSAFKTVGRLRQVDQVQTRADVEIRRLTGIVGQSAVMHTVIGQIDQLSKLSLPVLIIGEVGTGRMTVARSLHVLGRRGGSFIQLLAAEVNRAPEKVLGAIFGSASRTLHSRKIDTPVSRFGHESVLLRDNATVVIDNAEELNAEALKIIQNWDEEIRPSGKADQISGSRLILISQPAREFDLAVLHLFQAAIIQIPPLRDRPEDVLAYSRHYLSQLAPVSPTGAPMGPKLELLPDAIRKLYAHDWPGNIRELRKVIVQATMRAKNGLIGASELSWSSNVQKTEAGLSDQDSVTLNPMTEAEWLLDALRRNRFRRGETADFLGISRKTLYNRMRSLGLLR
ncbi:phosphoenolpyruvate hydrolase family protein [Brucellaceae bacterium C25G]